MRPKVDVEVVVVCRCVVVVLWVRWSGVGGPGQSFDNGVVRVDHPAAALLMKDCTMVVVKEAHGVFLTSRGIFCGSTPSKECDDKGMGILVELPGVVDDAGKFVVVMGLVVGDAHALGKKSRVVGKWMLQSVRILAMYWCCGRLGLSSWVAWNSSHSKIWSAGVKV